MTPLQHVDMQMDVSKTFLSPELEHKIFLSGYTGITLAGLTTILRLVLRMRYFGLDDVFATMMGISLLILAVAGQLYFQPDAPGTLSQSLRIALYYILAVNFNTTIWLARLSILFTIIRLGGYRRQLYTVSGCFVLAMLLLIAQVFWVCEPQNQYNHWKSEALPQCIEGKSIAIAQVTTDAFADLVLVAAPLFLLRQLQFKDSKGLKFRLIGSFIVGGLTTFVLIVHAMEILESDKISLFVGNVELAVSVMTANFAVLVAAILRLWRLFRSRYKRTNNSQHSMLEPKMSTIVYGAPPSDLERGLSLDQGSRTS
ncbi:hypothetical protein GYMLUDRAFT_70147 [Collybiopsis luxurians FD-317 M1]|nr:hypothetical protein GYMLUDRAFT_70147 [Collybiopsis luxurians FD-317 M1]